MKIINQHGKLNFYINMVLIFIAMAIFTIPLSAAEKPEKHTWSNKFELRAASDVYVEGWEKSLLPSGQSIWVSPETSIDNSDVLQAELKETINGPAVMFLLTEEGSLKFARFTKSNTGKFVAIMIDNRVMSAPKIIGEITGGRALIEGNMTKEEAIRITEGIVGN